MWTQLNCDEANKEQQIAAVSTERRSATCEYLRQRSEVICATLGKHGINIGWADAVAPSWQPSEVSACEHRACIGVDVAYHCWGWCCSVGVRGQRCCSKRQRSWEGSVSICCFVSFSICVSAAAVLPYMQSSIAEAKTPSRQARRPRKKLAKPAARDAWSSESESEHEEETANSDEEDKQPEPAPAKKKHAAKPSKASSSTSRNSKYAHALSRLLDSCWCSLAWHR